MDLTVYEVAQCYVVNPRLLHKTEVRFKTRKIVDIKKEIHQPDRRELDNIIFDVLGLTQGERDAVYEAVIDLVRQRLEKAKSR